MEATNAIINAIEATNATVDQLVQQGNELCDDVDNLRAEDERLGKEVDAIRASVAADKEHISANKEAIASQAKDLADLRATVADLRSGLANDLVNLQAIVEAQTKEIADLRAIIETMHSTIGAQVKSIEASKDAIVELAIEANRDALADTPVPSPADTPATPGMAALIARIPKPAAVRTRAAAQPAPVVGAPVVEAVVAPVVRKEAATPSKKPVAQTTAVETRAYARQYMIENGAKVEQLRDPAAIEATVASDAFAAWLAAR